MAVGSRPGLVAVCFFSEERELKFLATSVVLSKTPVLIEAFAGLSSLLGFHHLELRYSSLLELHSLNQGSLRERLHKESSKSHGKHIL